MEHSEGSKRSRKPYTLTKTRESWSNDEHERFIKALQLYNRDWKKIETYVGTKTVVQIRSHAQKYFQKVMKAGITDAIPPPRPKRRASDPPHGHPAACHTETAKLMRMASDAQPSRQNSGKDEDSDEGMQLHHSSHAAGHAHHTQRHHAQHHSSKQQQQQGSAELQEASAQLEVSRSLISCQGLQQVYLFLASLFSQQQSDLPAMLQRLSTRDRTVLAALLTSLVEELSHQQQQQPGLLAVHPACQHTQLQDQQQQQQHEEGTHQAHADEHVQQQQQHGSGGNGSGGQPRGGAVISTGEGTAAVAAYAAGDVAHVNGAAAAVGADAAAAAAAAGAHPLVAPSANHHQQQQQHAQGAEGQLGMQQAAEQGAVPHPHDPHGAAGQQQLMQQQQQQQQLQPLLGAAGAAVNGGYTQQLQELEPMAEG